MRVQRNSEDFEKREQVLKLRAKVLQAEQERLDGLQTLGISDARRKQLKGRMSGL